MDKEKIQIKFIDVETQKDVTFEMESSNKMLSLEMITNINDIDPKKMYAKIASHFLKFMDETEKK